MKGFSEHFNKADVTVCPEKTAVIVVDLLNDFMKEGGSMVLAGGMAVVPPIVQVIEKAKSAGSLIVYIKDNHRDGVPDKEFWIREPHCLEGTWGAELIDELQPQDDDYVIKKRRFSSFFQTELDLTLRNHDIETLIIVGVVTNICVRSTIHDGFFLGYKCIIPEECVMATSDREQESSLWDIDTHFGWVMSLKEVLSRLD
jgi:ureidoacrylate peracid hydrolase